MQYKKLNWKQIKKINLEYRADVRVNGLFGIRFQCTKSYTNEYSYKYIINGKHYGGYSGYVCNSFEHGKELCEKIFEDYCAKILNVILESEENIC